MIQKIFNSLYFSQNYIKIFFIASVCFYVFLSILNPSHTLPWVSFYSEKYCFIALILLMLYMMFTFIEIPKIIIPILLIIIIPIFQYFLGIIVFYETMLFSTLYLFGFFAAAIMAYNLCLNREGQNHIYKVIEIFSYTFIVISLFSSFIIIIQWLNFYNLQPYILKVNSSRPYGNLAQPNQMATILFIGLISLWYLYEKESKNKNIFFSLALLFLFSILLTQSRTSWVVITFLLIYFSYIRRKIDLKIDLKSVVIFILFFIGNIFLLPFYNNLNPWSINTRSISERATSGYERLEIWQHFINCILEHPISGYGWYQTQLANVSFVEDIAHRQAIDSTHNIILDILLWCGLPIGGLIILYLSYLLLIFFIQTKNKEMMAAFLMIMAVVIHAFFEYPLFYTYFLFPCGFLIGMMLSQIKFSTLNLGRILNFPIFILVIFSFVIVTNGYNHMYEKRLNSLIIRDNTEEKENNFFKKNYYYFIENYTYDRSNFIIYWIKFDPYTTLDENEIISLEDSIMATATKQTLKKYAILLAYNGHRAEAEHFLKIIYYFYGDKILYPDLFDQELNKNLCRFCDSRYKL